MTNYFSLCQKLSLWFQRWILIAQICFVRKTKTIRMKKLGKLLSFALTASGLTANAQWSTSGSDIYNSNSGGVGIGTSMPQEKLTVQNGDFLLTGKSGFTNAGHRAYILFGDPQLPGQMHPNHYICAEKFLGLRLGTFGYADLLNINENGNVVMRHGKGNINLAIGSAYGQSLLWGTSYVGFNLERTGSGTWTKKSDGANNGAGLIWGGVQGDIYFSPIPNSNGGTGDDQNVLDNTIAKNKTLMVRWNSALPGTSTFKGQVIIGKETQGWGPHTDFRLSVDGKLVAQEIIVTMNDWADYVFNENYKLLPILEVEDYYKKHKHLPGIPSEKDMIESGNNLVETDKMFMRKIEELTIYNVELKKELDQLKAEIATFKKETKN
jgi:hypothetical protein